MAFGQMPFDVGLDIYPLYFVQQIEKSHFIMVN